MADRSPLLTLATLVDHPTVVIDGTPYALKPPDALPLLGYHRFRRMSQRLVILWNQEEITEPEGVELEQLFDGFCRIVLDAPAEVQSRLTDVQRLEIYQAFLALPQASLRAVGARLKTGTLAMSQTGARSSRGSRGSMGRVRARG